MQHKKKENKEKIKIEWLESGEDYSYSPMSNLPKPLPTFIKGRRFEEDPRRERNQRDNSQDVILQQIQKKNTERFWENKNTPWESSNKDCLVKKKDYREGKRECKLTSVESP